MANNNEKTTIIKAPSIFYKELVSKYDFVLILNSNTRFWNEYGFLFPSHDASGNQLFKIDHGKFIKVV